MLKVRDLRVAFRGPKGSQNAVDGISFDLAAGEIVALVGESGCGKSATANALMNLLPAHTAETSFTSLQLDGSEISLLKTRGWQSIRGKEIAMVFQEPATALDPVFTVGHQIGRIIRRHQGVSMPVAWEMALQALEQSGFASPQAVAGAYPHQLSGGMRQLAMIALAVATRPRVLIADEPTTALDVTTQSLVLEQLKLLRERHGTAVLLVTHDLGVAAQCCDRAMVMYCGKLVEQADYARLYRNPRHPYTSGLFASVPRITAGRPDPVRPIPGRVPSISNLPPGCHFADRCPHADDNCLKHYPTISTIDGDRVACHHPLEIR